MDLEDFLRGGYKQMASTPSLLDIIIEAEQLADAIDHLHKPRRPEGKNARLGPRSICHLDLKPRNILVFKESSKPSTGKWKITDFGISRMGHEVPSEMSDEVSEDDASNYARWAGTFNAPPPPVGSYQCPDSFVHPKNDIWSFGCILVRLFALAFDPSRLEELDRSRIGKTHGSDSYDHDHFLRRSTLRLNPHVASWIKALPERYGMDYDTRFLKGIRHLLGSMLSLNIQNRLTAHKVYINLLSLEDLLLQSERQSEESRRTSRPSTIAGGTIDTYQSPGTIAPTTPEPDDLPPITTLGIFINQILNGTVAEVKELLQRRRDLEKSYNGKRPLIWAIERKDGPVLQALLEHDPKPDLERLSSEDSDAQTPLHLAISVGSVDIVTHLLEAGALVDSLSQSGMTPLMHAAHRGHADIIKELLRFNADWKIFKARDNWNCLHYAVNNIHCSVDVIKAFNGHMDFDWTPPDLDEHKPFTTPLRQHVLKCFGFYSKNEHDKWCEKFDALIAGGADVNREHIPHSSHPSKTMLEIIVHEHEQDLVLVAERLIKAEATLSAEYRKPRYISFAMKDLVKSKFPSAESSRRPGHLRTRTISSFFQR